MKKQIILIQRWLVFFIIALFLSSLTAMPVERELAFLTRCFPPGTTIGGWIETFSALPETVGSEAFIGLEHQPVDTGRSAGGT